MNKTKIEWTDYTWNPIKGICPVGCWYCYARKIYKRFGWNPRMQYAFDGENSWTYIEKFQRCNPKPGSKIFVCSTFELFHPMVKEKWRDEIFQIIKCNPQYTFQILTKLPQNIDRPMPDNVWLGLTITGEEDETDAERFYALVDKAKAKVKFISFEPLLGDIDEEILSELCHIHWVIIGRLTGYGKKHDPSI